MFFEKLSKCAENLEKNFGLIMWISFQIVFFVGCIIVYVTPNMRGCWTKPRVFCASNLQILSWVFLYGSKAIKRKTE